MGMKDQFKNKQQELAEQAKKSGGRMKDEKSGRPERSSRAEGAGRERAEGEGMQERMRDEFDS